MEQNIQPVPRTHKQAEKAYDNMARWYDLFAGSEKKFSSIGLQMIAVQPGEQVLEIGCGTGHALIELGKACQGGSVSAVDISEGMLRISRRRVHSAGLDGIVTFHKGSAASLAYPDDTFNAVFISFTLELFDTPDIPIVLGECHRVLRPGGRLCVVSLEKVESLIVKAYEWGHKHWPELLDCRPIYTRTCIEAENFQVISEKIKVMWGLPVAIVLAQKV
ncbi:MAG: methyltransferase domain-containing protein [Anaerolineales bacterium]|nr:methyltransferase domain-containing protein [Anaerolineales bacterium]